MYKGIKPISWLVQNILDTFSVLELEEILKFEDYRFANDYITNLVCTAKEKVFKKPRFNGYCPLEKVEIPDKWEYAKA